MSGRLSGGAFAALILATAIVVFDLSMINLAMPVIAAGLDVPLTAALWLSKANLLTCATCILPCAALGNRLGHRSMLSAGLLIVLVAMLGCSLSDSLPALVTWRAVLGAGSAAIMCSTLVLIGAIAPQGTLGRAMGLNAFFVAFTNTAGPALTGLLLQWLSWHWLFAVSLPVVIMALILTQRCVPQARVTGSRFDWLGSMILGLLLATLLGSASNDIPGQALGLGAVLLVAAFLIWQQRCEHPLLPLSVFYNPRLDSALLASVLAFIGQSAAFITVPVILQRSLGYTPFEAALVFMVWPLMTALIAPWAGRWADRLNPRRVAEVGLVALTLGLFSLSALGEHADAIDVLWRMALCGIGFGLFQSPNNQEILLNVAKPQVAHAAALLCLARLAGQAIGAVLVALLIQRMMTATADSTAMPQALATRTLGAAAALQLVSLLGTTIAYRRANRTDSSTRQPHRSP